MVRSTGRVSVLTQDEPCPPNKQPSPSNKDSTQAAETTVRETIWYDVIDIGSLGEIQWRISPTQGEILSLCGRSLVTSCQPQMGAEAVTEAVTRECAEYIKLTQHHVDFDKFWEEAREDFPNLYLASGIVRYLTLSTARCESVFSQAKSIIGLRRASLKTSILEQLLVLKTTQKALD